MRVALAYDTPLPVNAGNGRPEDMGAEYEDATAIEGLMASIAANGHEVVELVLDQHFAERVTALRPDLVFNIAEGVRGPTRESIVPAWLDHMGVPYTGSDGLTLALTLDKALTKSVVGKRGIVTPAFRRIRRIDEIEGIDLGFPLFVKPNAEGSSMGIRRTSKVATRQELERQVEWVLDTYEEDCLVERFAPGPEYCVGILGNDPPELLPIVEVRSPGDFYSYEDKRRHRKELVCPAVMPDGLADGMRRMGLEVYRALRCRDFARMDFKVDAAGRPSFLEINPLPGLAAEYGVYTHQARAAGIDHAGLIGRIIGCAMERASVRPGCYAKKERATP